MENKHNPIPPVDPNVWKNPYYPFTEPPTDPQDVLELQRIIAQEKVLIDSAIKKKAKSSKLVLDDAVNENCSLVFEKFRKSISSHFFVDWKKISYSFKEYNQCRVLQRQYLTELGLTSCMNEEEKRAILDEADILYASQKIHSSL